MRLPVVVPKEVDMWGDVIVWSGLIFVVGLVGLAAIKKWS
jgi:hypothetical protein